jgi:hypothetical protein
MPGDAVCLDASIQYVRGILAVSISTQVMFGILIGTGYLASPTVLIWGWIRWISLPKLRTAPSVLSFAGFILATASALLAVSSMAYSVVIRRFPFYDPLLIRIFAWGILLSLGGIVFGIGGVWRPNSLRWHAPASAACMLTFWVMMASME